MRKLLLSSPRLLWKLYHTNNVIEEVIEVQDVEQNHGKPKNIHERKVHVKSISKMLLVNEHKRKCLSDERRKVEVAESITPSLQKQFDIQESR